LARAYSVDLRERVIGAIEEGVSTREAARRFAIGESTAGAWHRAWRATGSLEPGRQGHPKVSKLDPHEAFILSLVDTEDRDITLAEIADRLEADRGLRTCAASIHGFFKKRGITFKKRRRTPRSSSARTCLPDAGAGSTANSTSIRAA
jgi:transposase